MPIAAATAPPHKRRRVWVCRRGSVHDVVRPWPLLNSIGRMCVRQKTLRAWVWAAFCCFGFDFRREVDCPSTNTFWRIASGPLSATKLVAGTMECRQVLSAHVRAQIWLNELRAGYGRTPLRPGHTQRWILMHRLAQAQRNANLAMVRRVQVSGQLASQRAAC